MALAVAFILFCTHINSFYKNPDEQQVAPTPEKATNQDAINEQQVVEATKKEINQDSINITIQSDQLKGEDYSSVFLSIAKFKEGSADIRLSMWKNSLGMVKDNPILGVGLENWRFHYPLYHHLFQEDPVFSIQRQPVDTHNEYVQMLCETSPLGLMLFTGIFITVFWRCRVVFRNSKSDDIKLRILFYAMVLTNLLTESFFSFPLRMSIPPLFLFITTGMISALDSFTMNPKPVYTFNSVRSINVVIMFLSVVFLVWNTNFNFKQIAADHHFIRGSYFDQIGNWPMAAYEAKKAVSYIPWRHHLWFGLGKAYENLGLIDKAKDAYGCAIDCHPNHLNTLLQLGFIHIVDKDFKIAEYLIEKALRIKPDLDQALFAMGNIKEGLDEIEHATQYYLKTLSMQPHHAEAHYRLGIICMRKNQLDESKIYLEKAYSMNPQIQGIHFQLGTLYLRLNMAEKAEAEFLEAIRMNSKDAKAYTNLGLIYGNRNQWEKAADAFQTAIEINPDLGEAHVNLSLAYYMLKDYNSALKHAQRGSALNIPQADILIKKIKEKLTD